MAAFGLAGDLACRGGAVMTALLVFLVWSAIGLVVVGLVELWTPDPEGTAKPTAAQLWVCVLTWPFYVGFVMGRISKENPP